MYAQVPCFLERIRASKQSVALILMLAHNVLVYKVRS